MNKIFLALTLALATIGVSAHQLPMTHYHTTDGKVVIGNRFFPTTVSSFEVDRHGRRVIVTTTTRCIDTGVNRRNNHLRCRQEETTVERRIDESIYDHGRSNYDRRDHGRNH